MKIFSASTQTPGTPADVCALRPILVVSLRPSRIPKYIYGFTLSAAALLILLLIIPAAQRGGGATSVLLMGMVGWSAFWALNRSELSEISIAADDHIQLRRRYSERTEDAKIIPPAFVSANIIALRFRIDGRRFAVHQLIFPDQTSSRSLRALRIRLRHLRDH